MNAPQPGDDAIPRSRTDQGTERSANRDTPNPPRAPTRADGPPAEDFSRASTAWQDPAKATPAPDPAEPPSGEHTASGPLPPGSATRDPEPAAAHAAADPAGRPLPEQISRYRILRQLGRGAFGTVYLGEDEELRRPVAIKVPHPHRVALLGGVEVYLAEARVLAALDHPAIVPVYDVGRSENGLCYVVSKFIEGGDLAVRLAAGRMEHAEAVRLIRRLAEALHHAHSRQLVHRDVKPANIVLDQDGQPYLTDFGLALQQEEGAAGPRVVGTPQYMSPEQARGESHRVDGRSDIYSLGVVFYQLLTGQRPFQSKNYRTLAVEIATTTPPRPRDLDPAVPAELERICLKALSPRAVDRYATARDFAAELADWEAERDQPPALVPASGPPPIRPRGLRPFAAEDAGFFLGLLPGPRDRDGLPEAVHFWKARIETADPGMTFSVSLLLGASGSGKSSLVRAGLLPRLASQVTAVYVEASARDTEPRLLAGLRQQCPRVPAQTSLAEMVAVLRRGRDLPVGHKVLLVLDQFEQWLLAHAGVPDSELVAALRHCDGAHVQALLMVRDDFALAAAQLFEQLEVPLVQGQNFAALGRLDRDHARDVLAAFGQALGRLPASRPDLTREQKQFLDRAVEELAEAGTVIPVRLAVFVEMVKDKPWTPSALRAVGGAEGIGIAFLEETFASPAANPRLRAHPEAARAVLRALLPPGDAPLRGTQQSSVALRTAAGWQGDDWAFAELLAVLNGELRLITPVQAADGTARYQLAHDYLVPAVRRWLTLKQRETLRGRAEIQLEEHARAWAARPGRRQLPPWYAMPALLTLTRRRGWSDAERRMLWAAVRYHSLRAGLVVVVLGVLALLGFRAGQVLEERHQARALVRDLLDAQPTKVQEAVARLTPYWHWAEPQLTDILRDREGKASERRRARLCLLLSVPGHAAALDTDFLDPQQEISELLLEADRPWFSRVVPLLQRHAAEAFPVLEQEIRRQPEPRWVDAPLPADGRDPDAGTIRSIEAAGGMVDANFAFCQTLPLTDLSGVAERLRAGGYRPRSVRPYAVPDGTHVAAVWTRDARDWRVVLDRTAAEFRREDEAALRDHLLLADVAPYLMPAHAGTAPAERYAGVWAAAEQGTDERRVFLGLDDAEMERTRRDLDEAAFLQLTHRILDLPKGRRHHTAFWSALPPAQLHQTLRFDGSAGDYAGDLFLARLQTDVDIGRSAESPDLRTRMEDKLRQAEQELRTNPRDPNWRFRRGYALSYLGREEEALAVWNALFSEFPAYAWNWTLPRGLLLARRGDLAGARADLEEFRRRSKEVGKVAYLEAYVTASAGDCQAAVTRLDTLVREYAHDAEFLYAAANAAARVGEVAAQRQRPEAAACADRALTFLEQAVRAGKKITPAVRDDPDFESIRQHPRFRALLRQGQLHERYAALWQVDKSFESAEVHGLPPAEHRRSCRLLAAEGFRPVALAAFQAADAAAPTMASVWHRPLAAEDEKQRLADRQARAALALLHLGRVEIVWPLLQHRPDPRLATAILHRLAPGGVELPLLVRRLRDEPNADIRRVLLLAVGQYAAVQRPGPGLESLQQFVRDAFRTDPDAGVHSAAEWLLRQWSQPGELEHLTAALRSAGPRPGFHWYVNRAGDTLSVAGPVQFEMGARPSEWFVRVATTEQLHRRQIPRRFALATKEVTNAQFQQFLAANPALQKFYVPRKDLSPTPDCPALNVSWYLAIEYCRWLTAQEGLPREQQCYDAVTFGEGGSSLELRQGYLARTGYRLPTEAEWEWAARGGTVTSRSYGGSDELMPHYGWCLGSTATRQNPVGTVRPVGLLLPNRSGCFDMLGNAAEWTTNLLRLYRTAAPGEPVPDSEELAVVPEFDYVAARGSSYHRPGEYARSALRLGVPPTAATVELGFRVARTLPE